VDVSIEGPRHDKPVRYTVWTTWTQGKQWERQPGDFKPGEPIVLRAIEARRKYGVYVTVTTDLELSNEPPRENTPPMAQGYLYDPSVIPPPAEDPSKRVIRARVTADTEGDDPPPPPQPPPKGIEKDDESE
jgi:hypothetical protein